MASANEQSAGLYPDRNANFRYADSTDDVFVCVYPGRGDGKRWYTAGDFRKRSEISFSVHCHQK